MDVVLLVGNKRYAVCNIAFEVLASNENVTWLEESKTNNYLICCVPKIKRRGIDFIRVFHGLKKLPI